MVAVRKHSTWQEDILLLNYGREIKRAGSVLTLPAQAISTKNKHLLAIDSNLRSQPAVSRRLFQCLGHTSSEALKL
jgi:hypothetical protein